MYQNFFIHSSVDGRLGCFHDLAIANSAAMNNGIHVYFSVLVSSGYMREGDGTPLRCSCLEKPRDGEPGGLPSMGSLRVRHD